jgi:hypothetical protein
MAKSADAIYNLFSREIFGKPFNGLPDFAHSFFICRQVNWYRDYRKKISTAARQVMDVKKLRGKDYDLILEWYLKQIPPSSIRPAIEECSTWAKRNDQAIYSMNYFKRAVTRQETYAARMSVGAHNDTGVEDDDKWHFKSYTAWSEGKLDSNDYKYFSPFIGPNSHTGVNR